jgi:iron complex outermembrane receptor protein
MPRPALTDPLTRLEADCLSILVLRDGEELYRSYHVGVRPLLELVEWFPGGLTGATAADRTVGGCAARVFAHLKVARVMGLTGSLSAERILHAEGIDYVFRRVVFDIRNRDDTDTCPFEKLSAEHREPAELLGAIERKLAELRRRK